MKVNQIYEILSTMEKEVLGTSELVKEDLSGLADFGKAILDAMSIDNYVKRLINHIGKVVFVDRVYEGLGIYKGDFILRDSWTYGSILEKIDMDWPDVYENQSWNLVDGADYPVTTFHGPKDVRAKFFNEISTYEIRNSTSRKTVLESFSSPQQMSSFFTTIQTHINNRITSDNEDLAQRLVNAMIAETMVAEFPEGDYDANSGVRAVNVFKLFKDKHPDSTITLENALEDIEYLKFFSKLLKQYRMRLAVKSKLFNIDGRLRFTPADMQRIIFHEEVYTSAEYYMDAVTFHDEYVKMRLDNHAVVVPYWQGTGVDYSFSSSSEINVETRNGNTVELSGILAVLFDRDSMAICNEENEVETFYVGSAQFTNWWYKPSARYMADTAENFIVFYQA